MNQQLQQGFAEPCHFCNSNNPTCLNGKATHQQLLHSNHIAYQQPSHLPACVQYHQLAAVQIHFMPLKDFLYINISKAS
jgi:hypothetical protein